MVAEIAVSSLFYHAKQFQTCFIILNARIKSWEEGIEGLPAYKITFKAHWLITSN